VQLHAQGVQAFAVHPGKILTPLQRHMERPDMVAAGWIDEDFAVNPVSAERLWELSAQLTA
jgi:NAD(P)-dependent dehydrogenase (short-subunit alcohol dehydrogenase family)